MSPFVTREESLAEADSLAHQDRSSFLMLAGWQYPSDRRRLPNVLVDGHHHLGDPQVWGLPVEYVNIQAGRAGVG